MKLFIFVILLAGGSYYYFFEYKDQAKKEEAVQPSQKNPTPPKVIKKTQQSKASIASLMESRQFASALKIIDERLSQGESYLLLLQKVEALEGSGNPQEALRLLNKISSKAPEGKKAELLWFKGEMLLNSGHKKEAGDVFYSIIEEYPSSSEALQAAFKLKKLWLAWLKVRTFDKELPKYNLALSYLLENAIDENVFEECYKILERVNARIFFSPHAHPNIVTFHKVKYGDILVGIAKKHKVYSERIARVNNLKNRNSIRAGQTLRIILGRSRVKISKSRFNMDVYLGNLFFKRYKIGIGKSDQTPIVVTQVSKSRDDFPDYTDPNTGELFPYGHKRNPIGTRWIGFTMGQGYGIHGTTEPQSIGKAMSDGCIRMLNRDVEYLYDFTMVGDEVIIDP